MAYPELFCRVSCRWIKLKKFARPVRRWNSRCSFTARCVSRIPGVACCRDICRIVMPIRAVVQTPCRSKIPGSQNSYGCYTPYLGTTALDTSSSALPCSGGRNHSFKIEGRTKSIYYVTRVCQSYRGAIDDAVAGREFDERHIVDLEKLSNRGYTSGFYQRHNHKEYQTYDTNHSRNRSQIYVGEVLTYDAQTGLAEVEVKNKIQRGDDIEVIMPGGSRHYSIEKMLDQNGVEIDLAPGSGWRVQIALPGASAPALIARYIDDDDQAQIRVNVSEPLSVPGVQDISRRPSP